MKAEKLYVKNNKGRYVPYEEPEPQFDNALYRKYKRGNKVVYEPYSMLLSKDLPEGVWVVTRSPWGYCKTNGKYLRDSFLCQKASDLEDFPLSKLGSMSKLAGFLCSNWEKVSNKPSLYETCCAIVGVLFQYEEKQHEEKQRKKGKSQKFDVSPF